MRKSEEWKTALCIKYRHYEYTIMPTFQFFLNNTLKIYLNIFVIADIDNILVYTTGNLKEHAKAVKKVLKALQQADERLRPD